VFTAGQQGIRRLRAPGWLQRLRPRLPTSAPRWRRCWGASGSRRRSFASSPFSTWAWALFASRPMVASLAR